MESVSPALVIVVIVIILALLGAAAWYFMRQRTPLPGIPEDVTEAVRPVMPANKKNNFGGKTTSAGMVAALEILEGPDAKVDGMNAGRKIEIYSGKVRIGRSGELTDLQLYDIDDNSTVSRRHCTVEFDRTLNSFVIIDEESRSGTRVGSTTLEPQQRYPLKDGDIIELGFVEQSGARLRFTSPLGRVQRPQPNTPAVDTASVDVRPPSSTPQPAPPAAAIIRPKETADPEPDIDREHLPGVETELRHQHAPLSALAKPGTGPLGHPQEPCDVFLSYSRKDREAMLRVRINLQASSISVWTDENLTPGTPLWRQAIETAIEKAGCIVVILSPDAKQSPWVQRELDYASTQDKPIIPLLVRGDEKNSIPLTLISAQWADLREQYDAEMANVLNIVRETVEQAKQD